MREILRRLFWSGRRGQPLAEAAGARPASERPALGGKGGRAGGETAAAEGPRRRLRRSKAAAAAARHQARPARSAPPRSQARPAPARSARSAPRLRSVPPRRPDRRGERAQRGADESQRPASPRARGAPCRPPVWTRMTWSRSRCQWALRRKDRPSSPVVIIRSAARGCGSPLCRCVAVATSVRAGTETG